MESMHLEMSNLHLEMSSLHAGMEGMRAEVSGLHVRMEGLTVRIDSLTVGIGGFGRPLRGTTRSEPPNATPATNLRSGCQRKAWGVSPGQESQTASSPQSGGRWIITQHP